jgi:hypothetical protein
MEGGDAMLKLFFKDRVERDKTKDEIYRVLDELKVNREKYEGWRTNKCGCRVLK